MFDFVRSHRNWMMLFILVLIFPSFVFFGIQGYNSFVERERGLATVDGTAITQQDFDAALRERIDQLRQRFGEKFDARIFETTEARAALLDQLVLDRALTNEAASSNIVVSVDRLREVIAGIPVFQQDGKFSYDRYKAWLASQNLSEAAFEQRVRGDLRKQALAQAILESALVPKTVADRIEKILLEQREIRELRFLAEQYASKVNVTDAQITEYYESNRKQFETPENVRVEYLVLSPQSMESAVTVTDDAIAAYYEQNKSRYGTEEQRRASHILITAEGSDKATARRTAEQILAKVKANPKDFGNIARQSSKDPGSAAQGGDLGFFGRNMMVKPFEEVAFRLKEGEISDIVETDFGFHIIRLTEIKPAQVKPLAEARADIERELKNAEAQKRFAEIADQFTNLVYEQADSLQPAAEKLKLKVLSADNLTRQGLPPFITSRVVEAIFADESLKNRRNTQAMEVATNTLVSARVVEHRPAAVQPLEKVKPHIKQLLERREAVRLAREAGEAKLAELRKQSSDAGFLPARTVSRRDAQGLSPSALNEILRVSADKLPTHIGVELDNTGYLIAQVVSAKTGTELTAPQREAQTQALVQQAAATDELAYAEGLKARHKVEILRPELRRETAKPATDAKSDSKK